MFREEADRRHFKSLFARYLSVEPVVDSRGRTYPNFRDQVELLGLAIKTTHYHVTPLELEPGGAGALMRTVVATYVRYFNRKYGKQGAMFDGEVRLRPAANRREELNAIAYVHENHGDNCYCEFCSHSLYVGHPAHVPEWINVGHGLERFGGVGNYLDWLRARQIQRRILGEPEPW